MNNIVVKKRDSNIELLRIISMFLVLMTHACYLSIGSPTKMEITASIGSAFTRAFCEGLTDVCVNVFILISGWFGIKTKLSRLLELVFQVLFISLVVYLILRILGLTTRMSLDGWVKWLFIKNNVYWFVRAYLVLYVFAPVLNAFISNSDREHVKFFLVAFFVLVLIYGFYDSEGWFAGGYSPLLFMWLYVLARFMKLYPNKFVLLEKNNYFFIYVSTIVFAAIGSLALTFYVGKGETVLFLYSSPFILLSSICFFLFFTKISFYSSFINWVSISCFAAYLVHCSPCFFRPYYVDLISGWYNTVPIWMFVFYTSSLILGIFIFSILLDKIRILIWNSILKLWGRVA